MSDEIIEELWRIKDSIAREHGYDIEALVAYLQSKEKGGRSANCGSVCDKKDRRTR